MKMAAAPDLPCQRCKGYLLLQSTAHLADGNKIGIIRTNYWNSMLSQILHNNSGRILYEKTRMICSRSNKELIPSGGQRCTWLWRPWPGLATQKIQFHYSFIYFASFTKQNCTETQNQQPQRAKKNLQVQTTWTWPRTGRNQPASADSSFNVTKQCEAVNIPGQSLPRQTLLTSNLVQ